MPFEVWGGEQLRDFNYVDDVVEAFLMAAVSEEANGRIFNLGGRERISLEDTAALLVAVSGRGEYVIREFPKDRKRIDIGDYYADYTLIETVLGWCPKTTLEKGFLKTLGYFRTHFAQYL